MWNGKSEGDKAIARKQARRAYVSPKAAAAKIEVNLGQRSALAKEGRYGELSESERADWDRLKGECNPICKLNLPPRWIVALATLPADPSGEFASSPEQIRNALLNRLIIRKGELKGMLADYQTQLIARLDLPREDRRYDYPLSPAQMKCIGVKVGEFAMFAKEQSAACDKFRVIRAQLEAARLFLNNPGLGDKEYEAAIEGINGAFLALFPDADDDIPINWEVAA
jgi:hypothetical protein